MESTKGSDKIPRSSDNLYWSFGLLDLRFGHKLENFGQLSAFFGQLSEIFGQKPKIFGQLYRSTTFTFLHIHQYSLSL
ncbi:hypothetical protein EKQ44_14270 [Sutcliffiella horikoshii]|nr:hypothetical protein [Sutcliffiella horikoshii]